jgi:hypothetical protein
MQQAISISSLDGDRMAKICECDMMKKENKVLNLKVVSFGRKSPEVDEQKMEHQLQLKQLMKEMKALKVKKYK